MMNLEKAKIDRGQLYLWKSDYWVEYSSLNLNGKDILVFEVNFGGSYRVMYNHWPIYLGSSLELAVETYNKKVDEMSDPLDELLENSIEDEFVDDF